MYIKVEEVDEIERSKFEKTDLSQYETIETVHRPIERIRQIGKKWAFWAVD